MRPILLGACMMALAVSLPARADDLELNCESPTTSMEHDFCADRAAGTADSELNAAYRGARAQLDGKRRDLLTEAQRAWIGFRDKQCNLVRLLMDGSGRNVAYLECVIGLTTTRTRDLKEAAGP